MSEPPLLPLSVGPRVIVYYQTHTRPDTGEEISLLPLISNGTGITHIIVAAIHINEDPDKLTLNDDPPDCTKNSRLWSELPWVQAAGIKVMGMLGGAAKGSYERLGTAQFEAYYKPLHDLIKSHSLDGIDLDVEEVTPLPVIIKIIDRLRADFGPAFIITLAPVAAALLPGVGNLSGFDYRLLELARGHEVAWYNAQFYCGWGDASSTAWYDAMVGLGWKADKVVLGLITNPENGAGHVTWSDMSQVLTTLRRRYPSFGGVMGWEYFNALPGGLDRPWQWVKNMSSVLRTTLPAEEVSQQEPSPVRPYGANMPQPKNGWSSESIAFLQELGFTEMQCVQALNITEGNVDNAAALLLE